MRQALEVLWCEGEKLCNGTLPSEVRVSTIDAAWTSTTLVQLYFEMGTHRLQAEPRRLPELYGGGLVMICCGPRNLVDESTAYRKTTV